MSITPRVLVPKVIRRTPLRARTQGSAGAALMAAHRFGDRNYTMNSGRSTRLPWRAAAGAGDDGEVIRADPHIGLLHRAREAGGVEALTSRSLHGTGSTTCPDVQRARLRTRNRAPARHRAPERAQYIRVMFDEITRILITSCGSGLTDSTSRHDGVPAVLQAAEELMDVYEAVSGTRRHATYYRPRRLPRSAA